jgi:hypothetical protein
MGVRNFCRPSPAASAAVLACIPPLRSFFVRQGRVRRTTDTTASQSCRPIMWPTSTDQMGVSGHPRAAASEDLRPAATAQGLHWSAMTWLVAGEEDMLGSLAGVNESGRVARSQRRTGYPVQVVVVPPGRVHHSSCMCESTPRYRTCWVGAGTPGAGSNGYPPHACAEVCERRAGVRGEIFDVPAGRVPPELVDVAVGGDVVDVLGPLPGEDVAERLTRGRRGTSLLR